MQVTQTLHTALETIRRGGILAYPTEAVFGLGCDPANTHAVQRLLALKQRPADKGLILIAADLAQLSDYLQPLNNELRERVQATWPEPITWLLPVKPEVSPLIRGYHDSLAVRVSTHPVCHELCTQLGHPLISSSANLAEQAPARDLISLQTYFGQQLDCILDLPLGGRDKPSEIRDARTGEIIRPA
ncbi:MAG: threonylcarbamoyl-AMP synthase [Proteobacteria bacterium]|nr:MAG: threonylcarbamoyl-AMP synthase [Pseudomonadota bacterium]